MDESSNVPQDPTPPVTAVIATYNQADFVAEAIDSVLDQDYPNLDLVVVDDGSSDQTPEVLTRYRSDPRVTVFRQENQGQTSAKNEGLRLATGKYVAFCDSDDYWLPGKISRQVAIAESSPSVGLVYGKADWIDGEGNSIPSLRLRPFEGRVTAELLINNFVTFCTVLVRREALEGIGGFDTRLAMSIDYDAWLKISLDYDFRYTPDPISCYRIWEGQMSHNMEKRIENFLQLLDRFFQDNPDAVSGIERRRCLGHSYVTRGLWRRETGRSWLALGDYLKAATYWPLDTRLAKSMVKILIGRK